MKQNYSLAPATRAALFNFRELWTVQGASNFGLDINRCTVYGGNTNLFSRSLFESCSHFEGQADMHNKTHGAKVIFSDFSVGMWV